MLTLHSRWTWAAVPAVAAALAASPCWAQSSARTVTRQQLATMTQEAIRTGAWQKYLGTTDEILLGAIKAIPSTGDARRYDRVLDDPVTATLLTQSALIGSLSPAGWGAVVKTRTSPTFAEWLMTNREATADFLTAVKPGDNTNRVFEVWYGLWKDNPEARGAYARLALACALVFDGPLRTQRPRPIGARPEITAAGRYAFFCGASEKHRLKTQLTELPVDELVWVVDAPVSDAELAWAQTHVNAPRANWGGVYDKVKYRMDMVTETPDIYKDYSLAEILAKGGICIDQAYFAAVTAKANGIPAMPIVGEGQRGGHAWFGYKESTKSWNMRAGRYTSDDYATGFTVDPQTGAIVKEQALSLLADEGRRSPAWMRAWQLLWLAHVAERQGRSAEQTGLLEAAVADSPRHVEAWAAYVNGLDRCHATAARWREAIRAMRAAFRGYPDLLVRADTLEREKVLAAEGAEAMTKSLSHQTHKLASSEDGRTDLVLGKIAEEAQLLAREGKLDDLNDLYRKSLDQYGREVVAFQKLAQDYFAFAGANGKRKEALRAIDAAYRRFFRASGGGDYFSMRTQAALLEMIAGFYTEDGQDQQAARLRKDAERLRQSAAASEGKR